MMEVICYVCNEQTDDWRRNFTELKSQHSNTSIVNLLKRFLDDFESKRNIEDESNSICAKCLDRIDDYDWLCVSCLEKENELKELLWATEESHIHQSTVLLPEPECELNPDVDSFEPQKIKMDLDCEIKQKEPIDESDLKPNSAADPISIENQPYEVWTILVPIKQNRLPSKNGEISERPSSPSKKQIIEPNADNPKIPPDYKNTVFKPGCQPHPRSKIPLKQRYEEFVPKPVPEDQLERCCEKCKKRFPNASDYELHMNKHRRTCEICGIRFTKLLKYELHMEGHATKDKASSQLSCRICNFKFANEDQQQEHLQRHEGKSKGYCVICDKEYPSVRSLKFHVQTHGERVVLCDLCGKKFKTKWRMQIHRKIHLDDNPYKCSHCPKAFKTYTSLRSHEKIHTSSERPFTCSVCDMRFKRKCHWQVHEKRHTQNTKTEKCTLCSAAYEHKFHLKQHMEKKHGVEN